MCVRQQPNKHPPSASGDETRHSSGIFSLRGVNTFPQHNKSNQCGGFLRQSMRFLVVFF